MDKPLKQHIRELERRESELRVAQQALEHYQEAIKLEGQLQRT